MGERILEADPIKVTVGKVTAKIMCSGAIVWVGSDQWSDSFPIANLVSKQAFHLRMSKREGASARRRKPWHRGSAKALAMLIEKLTDAKQARKERR